MAPVQWSTWQMEGRNWTWEFGDQILNQASQRTQRSQIIFLLALVIVEKLGLFFWHDGLFDETCNGMTQFHYFILFYLLKRNKKDKPKTTESQKWTTFPVWDSEISSTLKAPTNTALRSLMLRFPVEEAAQAAEALL